jgi:hypothetical protein
MSNRGVNKCKYCAKSNDLSDPECIECQLIDEAKKDKREKAVIDKRDMECR